MLYSSLRKRQLYFSGTISHLQTPNSWQNSACILSPPVNMRQIQVNSMSTSRLLPRAKSGTHMVSKDQLIYKALFSCGNSNACMSCQASPLTEAKCLCSQQSGLGKSVNSVISVEYSTQNQSLCTCIQDNYDLCPFFPPGVSPKSELLRKCI